LPRYGAVETRSAPKSFSDVWARGGYDVESATPLSRVSAKDFVATTSEKHF